MNFVNSSTITTPPSAPPSQSPHGITARSIHPQAGQPEMFQKLLLFLQVLAPGACGRWDMGPMPMKSPCSCPHSAGTGARGTRSIPPGRSSQTPLSDRALIPSLAEFTQSSPWLLRALHHQMQQLWRRPGRCPPCLAQEGLEEPGAARCVLHICG